MREIFVNQEPNSNRALIREMGEKWPDDINAEPNPAHWIAFVDSQSHREQVRLLVEALKYIVKRGYVGAEFVAREALDKYASKETNPTDGRMG